MNLDVLNKHMLARFIYTIFILVYHFEHRSLQVITAVILFSFSVPSQDKEAECTILTESTVV